MIDPKYIEALEKEFKDIESRKAWNQVYERVRTEGTFNYNCAVARQPHARNLNRYRDVLPYDHSRIILKGANTDYINASLLKVERVGRQYILTQGPLSQTAGHFWLMIWQEKTKGIVMLNKVIEKNQIKCHQYWPLGERKGDSKDLDFPSVHMKVELISEASHSHYKFRTLRLTNTSTCEAREIFHFHYTTWPDFGVPLSPEAFLKFLNVVRRSQCLESAYGPAVIHCSAGIGRSGTFCLVDSFLLMLAEGQEVNPTGGILDLLLEMRKYRMGLIQTPDQLRFSYQAIIYGAKQASQTNEKDAGEDSSCEELSMEEEPPQPPPRTESLTRSLRGQDIRSALGDSRHTDEEEEEAGRLYQKDFSDYDTCSRPLPDLPANGSTSSEVTPAMTPDEHNTSSNSVLRQRRHERKTAMTAKIQSIRDKTKEVEKWQERKRFSQDDPETSSKRQRP